MGVGTILESRRCLLLARGIGKTKVVAATIEGPLTSQVTASALQLHQDTIVLIDEEAACLLERRDYFPMSRKWQESGNDCTDRHNPQIAKVLLQFLIFWA